MFSKSSRYYTEEIVSITTRDGREVKAVKLRRLADVKGDVTGVASFDRLDIMAERRYGNGTMFWHIADANSPLQAGDLLESTDNTIILPKQ